MSAPSASLRLLALLCLALSCHSQLATASPAPHAAAAAIAEPEQPQLIKRQQDAAASSSADTSASASATGFGDPATNGGSWLTSVVNTYPPGLGEPLNVVLSNQSDPYVLTSPGFFDWAYSINFAGECAGFSLGNKQAADLGDGQGTHNQTAVLRYDYGDPYYGSCTETLQGGNHFRYWTQNGSELDSGAVFFATSLEQDLDANHMIQDDGYDRGRDYLVGNATASNGTKSPMTNNTYAATVQMVSGFLPNGTDGVNHAIAIDGLVAVLTVSVTNFANGASNADSTGASGSLFLGGGGGPSLALVASALSSLLLASWSLA